MAVWIGQRKNGHRPACEHCIRQFLPAKCLQKEERGRLIAVCAADKESDVLRRFGIEREIGVEDDAPILDRAADGARKSFRALQRPILIQCGARVVAVKLHAAILSLHPRTVFRISRGARTEVRNVFVRIENDGIAGYGEASPNAYYREVPEAVHSAILSAGEWLRGFSPRTPGDIRRAWSHIWEIVAPSRAAQCAVDLALWDWLARAEGCSVTELALGRKPGHVRSFCTIGLARPEEFHARLRELSGFPLIKVKSDAEAGLEPIREARAQTDAGIAVDANGAWTAGTLLRIAPALADLGILFIEQPLPPGDDALLPDLLAASPLPIMCDESCVTREDIARVPGRFSGFNIKLVKCGGLTPALEMLRHGRELGLQVMVGCMLESSVLIAAGAVVAQESDYADLDGAWLLADDPFDGLPFEKGLLRVPDSAGWGLNPRTALWQT
jgi:L-alanine-DL-glutamate epimerase-like enolase superfamily enzyme